MINMLDIHHNIVDFDLDFLKRGKYLFVYRKHKGIRKYVVNSNLYLFSFKSYLILYLTRVFLFLGFNIDSFVS